MKLLTISGLDGSGKSTQIQLLKDHLERTGKRVFYFHAVNFSLGKKIIDFRNKHCLICKLSGKCRVYKEKSVTRANALQIFLRKVFLRLDLWRFQKLYNRLRGAGYDYILSDRYFYDSLVNIEYLEKFSHCKRNEVILPETKKSEIAASPAAPRNDILKPDLAIYLDVSPETIMRRERKPDQGLEYLEKKYALYGKSAEHWQMKTVNGNRSKEEIFEEIMSHLI